MPLHVACQQGDLNLVQTLIDHNALVNVQTKDGVTPLFIAAAKGHTLILKSLIEHGADINIPRKDNHETALCIASQEGHLDVVQLLAQQNINLHSVDAYGFNAAAYAMI